MAYIFPKILYKSHACPNIFLSRNLSSVFPKFVLRFLFINQASVVYKSDQQTYVYDFHCHPAKNVMLLTGQMFLLLHLDIVLHSSLSSGCLSGRQQNFELQYHTVQLSSWLEPHTVLVTSAELLIKGNSIHCQLLSVSVFSSSL